MPSYAIIGASRGIGLEYVLQLAARPSTTVFAVVRNAKTATHLTKSAAQLHNVHIVEGDVGEYASLERTVKQIGEISGGTLDCLIHNAARVGGPELGYGYDDYPDMGTLDAEFIETYNINTLGVIHSIAAFLPLLRASPIQLKKIIVISSGTADPKFSLQVGFEKVVAYCASKAATNVVTTKWAVQLKPEGFVVIAMHPGAVDTWETRGESGDPAAHVRQQKMVEYFRAGGVNIQLQTPRDSVAMQLDTIDGLTIVRTGLFLNFDGKEWSM